MFMRQFFESGKLYLEILQNLLILAECSPTRDEFSSVLFIADSAKHMVDIAKAAFAQLSNLLERYIVRIGEVAVLPILPLKI